MKSYTITNRRQRERFKHLMYADEAETFKFDYSGWAEDNSTPTSVTITTPYGQATISGESLASGVKSFVATVTTSGKTLVELSATDGTNTRVDWLELWTKDLTQSYTDDYGMRA